jgi:hypothetical protein
LAREARISKVVAEQSPPTGKYKVRRSGKRQHEKPARPVRCVETGEIWPSIVDCAVANGGTRNGMGMAFRRAKGSPQGALFHGKHFVLVSEDANSKGEEKI